MLLGKCKLKPTSLRYSKEERWYTIECIEKTSLQNIGSGIECIDLTGVIYPRYQSNGLERLKNIRDTKEPHVLVDNSGNVLGNFVTTNVEEKQILFLPDPNYGLASKERHRNRGLFRLHGIGNQNRKNMN